MVAEEAQGTNEQLGRAQQSGHTRQRDCKATRRGLTPVIPVAYVGRLDLVARHFAEEDVGRRSTRLLGALLAFLPLFALAGAATKGSKLRELESLRVKETLWTSVRDSFSECWKGFGVPRSDSESLGVMQEAVVQSPARDFTLEALRFFGADLTTFSPDGSARNSVTREQSSSFVPDFSKPSTPQISLIIDTLTLLLPASFSALVFATEASAQPLKARSAFLRVVCLPGLP